MAPGGRFEDPMRERRRRADAGTGPLPFPGEPDRSGRPRPRWIGARQGPRKRAAVTLTTSPRDALWERPTLRLVPSGSSARAPQKRLSLRGRRLLNVLVAALGLVLTAPLMLVIAILIRLTSPGPVIYRQVRIGLNRRKGPPSRRTGPGERRRRNLGGKPFTLYKFRTMGWAEGGKEAWAHADDPRVTPLGRVLRAHRLDELPQLVNVLKGEMNVVGPRPEQPQIFAHLSRRIQRYPARQRVLPGITGLAQVELPYDRSVNDVRRKVRKDLEYIRNESLWADVKIMASTVGVMLLRRGAH